MLKKKSLLFLAIAAATLALAPAALADHGRRERGPSVAALAHQVQDASTLASRSAEHLIYPARRQAATALWSLQNLEDQARRFHRTVERGKNFRQVQRDYVRLVETFDRASHDVRVVRSPRVRRDFDRVEVAMARLNRAMNPNFANARYGVRRVEPRTGGSVVIANDEGRTRYRIGVRW